MGISLTGQTGLSVRSIRAMLLLIFLLIGTSVYFYGPMVAPRVEAAAIAECNEVTGGDFRAFSVAWVSWPETPHWSCVDTENPDEPIDLGWWVRPT